MQNPSKTKSSTAFSPCNCQLTGIRKPARLLPKESPSINRRIEAPDNIEAFIHMPYGLGLRFTHSGVGVKNYVVRITQGDQQIDFFAVGSENRSTNFLSAESLGITDFSTPINFELYTEDGNGEASEKVLLSNVSILKKQLKSSSFKFSYRFNRVNGINAADGKRIGPWTEEEIARIEPMVRQSIAHYEKIYGNPASDIPIILTKYVGSRFAIKLPEFFEIYMSTDVDQRLLAHELHHTWWCPILFTTNDDWGYDKSQSWMEEGLAEWAGHEVAALTNDEGFSNSWKHDVYDLLNQNYLVNNDFFYMTGGMGEFYTLYGMAANAFKKINTFSPNIIPKIYDLYIKYINTGHYQNLLKTKSRAEIFKDLIITTLHKDTSIEGVPANEWVRNQKVFSGIVNKGFRIFEDIQYGEGNAALETYCINKFYIVDIFEDGSGWFYTDEGTGSKQRYRQNGTFGRATIWNWDNRVVFDKNIRITPLENPPNLNVVGSAKIIFSSHPEEKESYIDRADFDEYTRVRLAEQGLYKIRITFNVAGPRTIVHNNYRPFGFFEHDPESVIISIPNFKAYRNVIVNGAPLSGENGLFIYKNFKGGSLQIIFDDYNGKRYRHNRLLPQSDVPQFVVLKS